MTAQSLTSRPSACPGGCDHTDEEHMAFDAGVAAGEAGKSVEECPYEDCELAEDWMFGHSRRKGQSPRSGAEAMTFWVVMLMVVINFWFAMYFFAAAANFARAEDYALCALYLVLTALNGGMGTSTLWKLWK